MPLGRLSDRLSFGQGESDVDDTMMDIMANRPALDEGGSFGFGDGFAGEEDDTVDLRADVEGVDGDYTENLAKQQSPGMVLDTHQPHTTTNRPKGKLKTQKCARFFGRMADIFRLSRHGIVVPALPSELIRNLAQQFSAKTLSKDALPAIEKASDLFFQNIS